MINTVILQGRFTRDPEIKVGGSTFTKFTLAVKDDYSKDKTHFVDCIAWASVAERIQRYFHKGDAVIVGGSLEQEKWTDKEGNQRSKLSVKVNQYWFIGAKPDTEKPTEDRVTAPITITDDDDLPF